MQYPRRWLRCEMSPSGRWLLAAIFVFGLAGCNLPTQQSSIPQVQIRITNPLPLELTDAPVVLTLDQVRQTASDFALEAYVVAEPGKSGKHIPSQAEDTDYDGTLDTLVFLVDLLPQQPRELLLHYQPQNDENMRFTLGYDKRTRAGIFPELGGGVCESELAAYRVLSGNRIDAFGKEQSGFQINAWIEDHSKGLLIPSLLGGSQVGIGTFHRWAAPDRSTDSTYLRVLANGPVRSTVQVIDGGLRADLSMFAGHDWLEVRVHAGAEDIAVMLPGEMDLVRNEADGFVYTWGRQTTYEEQDNAGFAIFYPRTQLVEIEEQAKDRIVPGVAHYLRLKPDTNGFVTYRVLAVWDHGHQKIEDEQAFVGYLKSTVQRFQSPPTVELSLPPDKTKQSER